ncbi:MAG: DUF4355 domain-containing protein [Streptococcaceae bacterium]|jgi:membrane protein involved in colicin uptake|nr:DUF4355 domain-containing protein [Streptococcaceae bacterium]
MKKFVEQLSKARFQLQIFDGEGGDGGTGGEGDTPPDPTFSQKELDAEADRRVSKAQKAWEEKQQKATDDAIAKALAEYEAKQKLSKDERKKAEEQDAENKRLAREAELLKRELTLDARELLTAKEVPVELIVALDFTDKASMEKSVDDLSKVYNDALSKGIEQGVEARLKQSGSPGSGSTPKGNGSTITQKEFMAMKSWERAEFAQKHPEEFQRLTGGI